MQPKPLGDVRQRKTLAQQLFERGAIHTPMIHTPWDGTLERMFAPWRPAGRASPLTRLAAKTVPYASAAALSFSPGRSSTRP